MYVLWVQDNVATLQQRKRRLNLIWLPGLKLISGAAHIIRGSFDIDSVTQCAKISRRNSLHYWKQEK
jgi:hypothetical protein